MKLTCLLGFALILTVTADQYPATFPLENEAYRGAGYVPSTPDFSYVPESDPGGYMFYCCVELGLMGGTITEDDLPYVTHHNGFSRYVHVAQFSAPPVVPEFVWNCTQKEIHYSSADFTGEVNGQKVCEVGECCSQVYGLPKFSEDTMTWHSWANDRLAGALCPQDVYEALYCIFVGGDSQVNCLEYMLTPATRVAYFPCPDSWTLFWLQCTVFQTQYEWKYNNEPPPYLAQLTNEQQVWLDANGVSQHRVCHPYSYYFPSTAGGDSGGGASPSANNGGTPASAPSADSSESSAVLANMILVGLSLF